MVLVVPDAILVWAKRVVIEIVSYILKMHPKIVSAGWQEVFNLWCVAHLRQDVSCPGQNIISPISVLKAYVQVASYRQEDDQTDTLSLEVTLLPSKHSLLRLLNADNHTA